MQSLSQSQSPSHNARGILSAEGDALFTEIIRPDDTIIRPARTTDFFAQLVMDEGREPTVTVTMRNDAVIREAR